MLLCGLDLETSGLDFTKDEILEIGLVLWDTDEKKPIRTESFLIKENAAKVNTESFSVNHISGIELEGFGGSLQNALITLEAFFIKADYIVAHNGNLFDKPFLFKNLERNNLSILKEASSRHWIDTSLDVPYPDHIKTRSLSYLAVEHGFINPFAHRALFDVLTMLKILSFYDINEVVEISKQPTIILQAVGEKPWEDGGKSNDEIRSHGYRWEGGTKRWLKTTKQGRVEDDIAKAKLYKVIVAS